MTRNALLNLAGHGLPLIFATVAIPFLIDGLGSERFGVLAMTWVVLGYLGVLDLGLGRASTKYLAEAPYRDARKRVALARTALVVPAAVSTLLAVGLFFAAPRLVGSFLQIPADLQAEAVAAFQILAAAVPLTLLANVFRAFLEGMQRFDLVVLGRVPFSAATFLLPLLGVWLGWSLVGVIGLMVLGRVGTLVLFAYLARRAWAGVASVAWFSGPELSHLFGFGKWAMLSSLVVPLFVYADRALIGGLRGMGDVTLYVPPYEMMSRILILPAAVAGSLFPAFSALSTEGLHGRITDSTQRATKYVALTMTPLIALMYIYAPELLRLWLGEDFSLAGTTVFRILGVAVLLNAAGFVPAALIEGAGRPDIIGKYHVVELPLYVTLAAMLISGWGIEGAATAWALRMVWTIPLFFYLCTRIAGLSMSEVLGDGAGFSLLEGALLMGMVVAVSAFSPGPWAKAAVACLVVACHVTLAWGAILSPAERSALRTLPRRSHPSHR